jgi:Secretion system C-terminal sorting domain
VKGILEVAGSVAFGNNNSFSGPGNVILGSGCSYWTGPGGCSTGTLPIKLLSFTAEYAKGVVKVEWRTASEENNEFFTIERTSDGVNYLPIATIPGAGTTLKQSSYFYEDSNPPSGKAYYRLSQTDYDGKSETFQHVVVDVADSNESSFRIFPNPLKGSVLNVTISNAGDGSIEVINMKGEKIISKEVEEPNFQLNLGDNLQPGLYYVNYKSAAGVKVLKLVKQ